jgi:hypothetical protein
MDLGNQMTSSMSFNSETSESSAQSYPGQNRGKNVWNYLTNSQFLSSVVEKAKVNKTLIGKLCFKLIPSH